MTEYSDGSKKDIAAVGAGNYPLRGAAERAPDLPDSTEIKMRTFMARTGCFWCVILAVICLSTRSVWAEAEEADAGPAAPIATPTSGDDNNKLGIGLFSRFPIRVSANVQGGYDDNVDTVNSGFGTHGSAFINASLVLSVEVGTPRTNLNLSTNTGFNYFFSEATNQYEPDLNLKLLLNHKVSPRLALTVDAFMAYQTEPNFEYALGTNRRAGNYFLTQDRLGVDYAWAPRFVTRSSWSFVAVQYDDLATGAFEDRIGNTFGNEFRFLLWPTTNLVAEYRFEFIDYQHLSARNSTTHYLLAGVDHAFSPRLTANFRLGAQFADYNGVGSEDSPYFESTVNYKFGKDTSASWVNSYGIQGGDIATSPTRTTFHTGILGQHNLTARVSASLGL
ncbi:MAG TPA: hypothetical protein VGM62_10975, partial [Chthoniobacterales bacterium]